MQNKFEELKVKLSPAPVLANREYDEPFVVFTDTSSKQLVLFYPSLLRMVGIILYIILVELYLLWNRLILHLKEKSLALFSHLTKFRRYLTSNRFKLYIDQQAMKYVFNVKDSHGGWCVDSPYSPSTTSRFVIGQEAIAPVPTFYPDRSICW